MPKSAKTTPVIELHALTKRYGLGDAAFNALDEVNLKIEIGEFIAIMGPSGCGKTTLLNVLGLLDSADEGDYILDGKPVSSLSGAQHARVRSGQVGIVFQNFNLINRLTVLENVALPLTYKGMWRTKRLERASEVLKQFHLQEREYYMPWQLSGGQMQRVAIARALVNEPSIILADEPTGNLDATTGAAIIDLLFRRLDETGATLVLITHDRDLAGRCSRIIHMRDGRIVADGAAA